MPTREKEKNVVETEVPRGRINHYGSGWGGPRISETGGNSPVDEKHADKAYVRVRSEIDSLVRPRGR